MAHVGPVRRWEIHWVDLDPALGSEQGSARRPALVVSNDGFNQRFDVVTVVPMTKREGKRRRTYPFEVLASTSRIDSSSIWASTSRRKTSSKSLKKGRTPRGGPRTAGSCPEPLRGRPIALSPPPSA